MNMAHMMNQKILERWNAAMYALDTALVCQNLNNSLAAVDAKY